MQMEKIVLKANERRLKIISSESMKIKMFSLSLPLIPWFVSLKLKKMFVDFKFNLVYELFTLFLKCQYFIPLNLWHLTF